MALIVQKYGGTSVGTIERLEHVAKHLANTIAQKHKLVVVVSAMGSHTDDLLKMALQLSPNPSKREVDMLLTAGERVTMSLLSIALHKLNISALSLTGSQCGILTDEVHGNARIKKVLGDRIRDGLNANKLVIVAGFQGVNAETKEITTLGRGGSDLTALALAHTLKADLCEIYKDVDGVCTADPSEVKGTRVLKEISWPAMTELAWRGASVIHARAIHVAAKYSVPFRIRSSFNLASEGTLVKGAKAMESVAIKAIAHKENMCLLQLKMQGEIQALGVGLNWLWEHGEVPLVNQQMQTDDGLTFITQILNQDKVDGYLKHLMSKYKKVQVVRQVNDLGCISVAGEGFWQSPETVTGMLGQIKTEPLFVHSGNTVFTVCLQKNAVAETMQRLHEKFLASSF